MEAGNTALLLDYLHVGGVAGFMDGLQVRGDGTAVFGLPHGNVMNGIDRRHPHALSPSEMATFCRLRSTSRSLVPPPANPNAFHGPDSMAIRLTFVGYGSQGPLRDELFAFAGQLTERLRETDRSDRLDEGGKRQAEREAVLASCFRPDDKSVVLEVHRKTGSIDDVAKVFGDGSVEVREAGVTRPGLLFTPLQVGLCRLRVSASSMTFKRVRVSISFVGKGTHDSQHAVLEKLGLGILNSNHRVVAGKR